MEQDGKRVPITAEVEPDIKRWLEQKAAERIVQGFDHGRKSLSAVVRDLLIAARDRDEVAA